MQITMFSDLHLTDDGDFLLKIVDVINKENSPIVVFLGDLFDKVTNITPKILNVARNFLLSISKPNRKIFMLSGNHDQLSSNMADQLLTIFNNNNIEVVNTGKYYKFDFFGMLFISYMGVSAMNNYIQLINNKIPAGVPNILFMHQSVYKESDPKYKLFGGISYDKHKTFFRKFSKIYLGHIHELYKYDNVEYIGPTSIKSFSDSAIYNGKNIVPKKLYITTINVEPSKISKKVIPIDPQIQYLNLKYDKYKEDIDYKTAIDSFIDNYKCNVKLSYTDIDDSEKEKLVNHPNIEKVIIKKEAVINNNIENISNLSFIKPKDFIIKYVDDTLNGSLKHDIINELENVFKEIEIQK